ncbi:hypothetical protein [Campylobacter concisus]|uniref:hypothetical protein n=1 Tax=Campylobacter concisus TaxID=199 RepID=UPI003D24C817
MLANKNVKVGEKFFKFDDAGDLYLLPALGFLLLGIYGFWMAFRSYKNEKPNLKYMWCKKCREFYSLGSKKCRQCGGNLKKYYVKNKDKNKYLKDEKDKWSNFIMWILAFAAVWALIMFVGGK